MRASWLSAGAVAACLFSAGNALAACDAKNAIFADTFDTLDPSWGEGATDIKVENGQVVISPAPQYYRWVPSSSGYYENVEICTTLKTVAAINPEQTLAGVTFWFQDNQNLYVFEIAANGRAAVYRQQKGKWIAPVAWQDFAAINKGDGAVNELRVVLVGNQATFFVNGQQFKQIKGAPPQGGYQVGLFAASFDNSTPTYSYDDFVLSQPEAAAPAQQ
jgi:hypothetical protein